MADTLLLLEQLDAADPRIERTDADREALVSASTRCIRPQVLPTSVRSSDLATNEESLDVDDVDLGVSLGPTTTVLSREERRGLAIARLTSFGRSQENAICVVDRLLSVEADEIFDAPNFGLGTDPFEASAFAACM